MRWRPRSCFIVLLGAVLSGALLSLPAGADEKERYERKRWPHWIDADRDCQNTRHELLVAMSLGPVRFKGRRPCKVARGLWRDAYTGELVANPDKLDVDHVVPLAEAYRSGGSRWTPSARRAFANDLDNLVLTRRTINRRKGDRDPSGWLPPKPELRCEYVRRWVAIKQRWGLAMDAAEQHAVGAACAAPARAAAPPARAEAPPARR